MIHTGITRNCTVFLLRSELTRLFMGFKDLTRNEVKPQFRVKLVWIIVFYF